MGSFIDAWPEICGRSLFALAHRFAWKFAQVDIGKQSLRQMSTGVRDGHRSVPHGRDQDAGVINVSAVVCHV